MVQENDLFHPVKMLLSKKGYSIFREVPFGLKRIDIVCTKSDLREIIAVEMKVKDWRRALHQAVINQLCVNKSYVALWHEYLNNVNIKRFTKYGIGVIEVNGYARVRKKAKPSSYVNKEHLSSMKKFLSNDICKR